MPQVYSNRSRCAGNGAERVTTRATAANSRSRTAPTFCRQRAEQRHENGNAQRRCAAQHTAYTRRVADVNSTAVRYKIDSGQRNA
jgi:hypothetical protein